MTLKCTRREQPARTVPVLSTTDPLVDRADSREADFVVMPRTDSTPARAGLCRLSIESDPPGARVLIDGAQINRKTNLKGFAGDGKYRIELRKDGYRQVDETFGVTDEGPNRFFRKLTPVPATQPATQPR